MTRMTNSLNKPPSFFTIFLKSWKRTRDAHWIAGAFPFFLVTLCIIAPTFIYSQINLSKVVIDDGIVITALSAFMVLSGFLGGFSISAMTQVQTISSTYPFSAYLKDEDLFDEFIFFPQFAIGVQIIAITIQCISIIIVIFTPPRYDFLVLMYNIFLLLYLVTKTWQLVNLIRVLTWHYENYMRLFNQYEDPIDGDD